MSESFFTVTNGRLYCRRYGRGDQTLLALHGFGRDGRIFAPLEKGLGDIFTIYAVDLPFHGKSEWEGEVFTPEDLRELRTVIQLETGARRFCALGYSLGGRLLLSDLRSWCDHLDGLFLLAPDGLGTRRMSIPDLTPAALRTWLCRRLQEPQSFLRLAGSLHRLRLIDPFSLNYLRHHLRKEKRRNCLLHTWRSLAAFPVSVRRLQGAIREQGFPIEVFTGTRDPLIDPRQIADVFQGLSTARVHLLDGTHRLLSEKLGMLMRDCWVGRG